MLSSRIQRAATSHPPPKNPLVSSAQKCWSCCFFPFFFFFCLPCSRRALPLFCLTLSQSYDSCHHSSAGLRSAFQGLQVHRFTRFCMGRQHRRRVWTVVLWWVPLINKGSHIHKQCHLRALSDADKHTSNNILFLSNSCAFLVMLDKVPVPLRVMLISVIYEHAVPFTDDMFSILEWTYMKSMYVADAYFGRDCSKGGSQVTKYKEQESLREEVVEMDGCQRQDTDLGGCCSCSVWNQMSALTYRSFCIPFPYIKYLGWVCTLLLLSLWV